ncbi:hypothetical protein [Streptosporangium saharense]|uniref:Uncharacterized protein n=1 Tax=Streptosporangium saharense TaxID=1706840 RepID=A0A7W7QLI6_9ACTN|nr:hypothetical protein [Streptosporangium saharense]MBB4915815.1 hypothetical protein [Streptosporangium saharense]
MTTARRRWIGVALVALALVLAGLSTLTFLRAEETRERLDGQRRKVAELLAEADGVKETDQVRHDELAGEAARYSGFAAADEEEYGSRHTAAVLLGAGASASLAGCLILLLPAVRGSRRQRV